MEMNKWKLGMALWGVLICSPFEWANSEVIVSPAHAVIDVPPDQFEENDTPETAFDLGIINDNRTERKLTVEENDEDWFRIKLTSKAKGGEKDFISIEFTSKGKLELYLYDPTDLRLLTESNAPGNLKKISLKNLVRGDYLILVKNRPGFHFSEYTLSVNYKSSTGDPYEENDEMGQPSELGVLDHPLLISELSIEQNDPDWFRFYITHPFGKEDKVSINYRSEEGPLNLMLYAKTLESEGNRVDLIRQALGSNGHAEFSLDGIPLSFRKDYFLQVLGHEGATNSRYELKMDVPPFPLDIFEDNDTLETASDLGVVDDSRTIKNISLSENNRDYFKIQLPKYGLVGEKVAIDFLHPWGDIDLTLLDINGEFLDRSDGIVNHEEIDLQGREAGTYFIKVDGVKNYNYSLSLQVNIPFRFEVATGNGQYRWKGPWGAVILDVAPETFPAPVTINLKNVNAFSIPTNPFSGLVPLGLGLNIGSEEGTQAQKPLNLTLSYHEVVRRTGVDPHRLRVARFDLASGSWVPLRNISRDEQAMTITVQSEHLTSLQFMAVPSNEAPVGSVDHFTTTLNNPLVMGAPGVLANDSDLERDPIMAHLKVEPNHGDLSLSTNGSFTYTPDLNFDGEDSFTYAPYDGTSEGNSTTVTITIKRFIEPIVYPTRFGAGNKSVTLAGAKIGSISRVFRMSGEKVRELPTDPDGLAHWNGRDEGDNPVGSGVYLIVMEGEGGQKVLKVIVQR